MFQDSRIVLSEKNVFRISEQSESRYRYEIPKAETPLFMKSKKADSPCSDHMKRGLDLVFLIAMRGCQSRSKTFLVKKFFLVPV